MTRTDAKTRVAIYARLSEYDDRDPSMSPDVQIARCTEYAEQRGWIVAATYCDLDTSAYHDVVRPQYERMMSGIRDGAYDVVLVRALDRFSRHGMTHDLQVIEEMSRYGCSIASLAESLDTSTEMGKLMLAFHSMMNREQSKSTSRRVSDIAEAQAKVGHYPPTRRRTFGYASVRANGETGGYVLAELDPIESERVRQMADRLINHGASFGQLARELNADGLFTTEGGKWSISSLSRYMKQPTIAGYRVLNGKSYRGSWPAIISEDQHHAIKSLRPKAKRVQTLPLTRLVRCCCGFHMQRSGATQYRYMCGRVAANDPETGLKHHPYSAGNTIGVDRLTADVKARLFAHLADIDHNAADTRLDTIDQLKSDLANTETRKAELVKARFVTGVITDDDYTAAYVALNEHIDKLQSRISQLTSTTDSLDIVRRLPNSVAAYQFADEHSIIDFGDLAKAAIASITIMGRDPEKPSNQYDPERVVIEWRDTIAASEALIAQLSAYETDARTADQFTPVASRKRH